MGGHKGYGLGLLVEILSGVLTGAAVTRQVGSWLFDDPALATDHGAGFLAINVGAMMPLATFLRRVDVLVDELHVVPTAEGCDRIVPPGEREWDHRRRSLAEGLELPDDVLATLDELADELGITPPRSMARESLESGRFTA